MRNLYAHHSFSKSHTTIADVL